MIKVEDLKIGDAILYDRFPGMDPMLRGNVVSFVHDGTKARIWIDCDGQRFVPPFSGLYWDKEGVVNSDLLTVKRLPSDFEVTVKELFTLGTQFKDKEGFQHTIIGLVNTESTNSADTHQRIGVIYYNNQAPNNKRHLPLTDFLLSHTPVMRKIEIWHGECRDNGNHTPAYLVDTVKAHTLREAVYLHYKEQGQLDNVNIKLGWQPSIIGGSCFYETEADAKH